MKRKIVGILIVTMLIAITLPLVSGDSTVLLKTIIVPDDYPTIQDAIDNSKKDDTIYVRNGTYYENIIIDGSIKIIGEDKDTTIIDGFRNGSVIKVFADNVFINDFTIQNSSLDKSEYSGIESYSSNNYYVGNILLNNKVGIHILNGYQNTIIYNYISGSQTESICIHSSLNIIYRNNIEDNAHGIWLQSDATSNEINQNNFINNTVYNAAINKALSNKWDQNYWDDWIGLKIPILKFLPKAIIGFFGFFNWMNLDWHPSSEPYIIINHPLAIMNTTMGKMVIELYPDKMPITTDNFIKLSNDGFYTGIVFHRVIDDFVIQGGGYYANGTNKKSPFGKINLETHPDVLHVDGAISMARTMMPNTATSQFFICDGPSPHLDGNYAAFGIVIDGIEILRAIAEVETTSKYGLDDWPVNDVIINNVTIENP